MQKACAIFNNENHYPNEEGRMRINYALIKKKVEELNEMGVDITLQEIGDIIESKFLGKPEKAQLKLKENGELMYHNIILIRYPKKEEVALSSIK